MKGFLFSTSSFKSLADLPTVYPLCLSPLLPLRLFPELAKISFLIMSTSQDDALVNSSDFEFESPLMTKALKDTGQADL